MKWLASTFLRVSFIGLLFFTHNIEATKVKSSRRVVSLLPHTRYLGKKCEWLAQKKIAKRYPKKKFKLFKNVTYRSYSNVGELDIVVINKKTSKVIYIAEVKCWKNLVKASKAADKQLNRFKDVIKKTLTASEHFFLKEKVSLSQLKISQFYGQIVYQKICQKSPDAKLLGFNSLSLSREDILK